MPEAWSGRGHLQRNWMRRWPSWTSRRVDMNVAEVMHLIGDVRGRTTLIVDDIIDTAGTLVKTAEALLAEGARVFMPPPRTPCSRGLQSSASRISAIKEVTVKFLGEPAIEDSVPFVRGGQ